MVKAYSVFDDFSLSALKLLNDNGVDVTVLRAGDSRPSGNELKKIIEDYDVIIISTGQKITEEMFENVSSFKIIATASIGIDHISVPENKKRLIKIVNAPTANRLSVAEHVFGLILALNKQFIDARKIAAEGKNKSFMNLKPHDINGKTMGLIGAGGISTEILKMAKLFGFNCKIWTFNPDKHRDLLDYGVEFLELDKLIKVSDIISVNLPYTKNTDNLISSQLIGLMKNDATFISISRSEVVDNLALLRKAKENSNFKVGLDVDSNYVYNMWDNNMINVIVTPHIAGGTVEARQRMFEEVCRNIIKELKVKSI